MLDMMINTMQDDHDAFRPIQDMLSNKPFFIKVGPTLHLGQNNVLEWTLKSIELKEDLETQEVLQPFDSSSNKAKDANEKAKQQTMQLANPEPVIPTPNMKDSSEKHTQERHFTETLESPQQDIESLKRKKSLGKSPVQFQGDENESQPPLSQVRAKKKLCFGGMTPEKHNPEISPEKDQAQDVPVPLETEKKQAKPVIVKTEKLK